MNVLLVGDSPLIHRLRAEGSWVYSAEHTTDSGTDLLRLMNDLRPDVVVYDVTEGSMNGHVDPIKAFRVNSAMAAKTALFCRMNNAHMWLVSDASIFPGVGNATDDTATYPVHTFGLSRMLGERAVLTLNPGAVIVRVGWLYGPEMPDCPPMIAEDTRNGTRSVANVQSGIVGSPTFIGDVAAMLSLKLASHWVNELGTVEGVRHLVPHEITDWYELLEDQYPKVSPTSIRASREAFMGVRNASLVPSVGWAIKRGGLQRFIDEIDGYSQEAT